MLSFPSPSHQSTLQLSPQEMQWQCVLRQQTLRRQKGWNHNRSSPVLELSSYIIFFSENKNVSALAHNILCLWKL